MRLSQYSTVTLSVVWRAVIIAGVVHQRPDRSVAQPGLGNGPSQSVDVADVAFDEMRSRVSLLVHTFNNSARWFLGDVNETDLGPLSAEVFDEACADPTATA